METTEQITSKDITITRAWKTEFRFTVNGKTFQLTANNILLQAKRAVDNSDITNIYGFRQFLLTRRSEWKNLSE